MKLEKKIAVITGAGRGIGESIAHTFADEGADLILTARTRQQLDRVADDIKAKNRNAAAITCDVSSYRLPSIYGWMYAGKNFNNPFHKFQISNQESHGAF